MKPLLSDHTRTVRDFVEAVTRCTLPHVPQTTKRLIKSGHWSERFEGGRIIKFDDFPTFITTGADKGGIGIDPDKVKDLLVKAGDQEALEMWFKAMRAKDAQSVATASQETQRPIGANQYGEGGSDKICDGPTLSRNQKKAERRLRKARLDLHQRVLSGELTWHRAMVEAGFWKPRVSRKLSPLDRVRRLIKKLNLSPEDRLILSKELAEKADETRRLCQRRPDPSAARRRA